MQKLKQHFKEISIMALAMVVLFSVSGFSIHSHHCSHSSKVSYSLYILADECNHSNEFSIESSCCKSVEMSCCSENKEEPITDDCCSNEASFVKLEVNTVLNHVSPELKISVIDLFAVRTVRTNSETISLSKPFKQSGSQEAPPPSATLEYLAQIQAYLI